MNRAKQAVSSIPQSIKDFRDANNQFYDDEAASVDRKIASPAGGQELAALRESREAKQQERAQALIEGQGEADKALSTAKAELADLLKQQAEAAANYKAPEAGQTPTAVQRAVAIKPAEVTKSIADKVDVGSTASFNSRVAGMLASNAKNKIEQEQLNALQQIAENTKDLDSMGSLAGGED